MNNTEKQYGKDNADSNDDQETEELNEENDVDSSINIGTPSNNYEIPTKGKVRRNRRDSIWMINYERGEDLSNDVNLNVMMITRDDPISFKKAIKSKKWRDDMMKEIEYIEKNKTWELTDLPKGVKPIRVKWIFKTKFKENGEIDKFEARLVTKGYGQ